MKIKLVEGFPWRRYRVRYRTTHGRRRSVTLWSPGHPWVLVRGRL